MGTLFSFTLASGIILLCLYLPYKLLLAREKQHRLNRAILYCMYLLALAMPLLMKVDFSGNHPHDMIPVADAMAGIAIGPLSGGIIEPAVPVWIRIVLWVYAAGVAVTLLRFVWSYVRLTSIVRKGCKIKRDGYTLVITGDESLAPFSWRKYIVVGDERDADESNAVMIHELRHLSAGHSMDLIMAQIYAVAVWYNPVSWLMIDEFKTVHEYEADAAVIDSGVNLKEYQMLLIRKTVGARLPSLANSLNHSKLKKRITMMYQSKSRMAGKLGSLALIPALAIGMAVVSLPAVASLISDASEATLVDSTGKVSKNSADSETVAPAVVPEAVSQKAETPSITASVMPVVLVDEPVPVPAVTETETVQKMSVDEEPADEKEEVYVAVEKMAEFPGGMDGLMKWLCNNIRYPEDAYKDDIQGRVIVKFIINKDGSVSDASVLRKVSPSLDEEAVRVVMAMPKWAPGEVNGRKVASYFNLPITFKLSDPEPVQNTDTAK